MIDSERQHDLLQRASRALNHVKNGLESGITMDAVSMDVREALDALGEIVGEVSSADMLADMFSRFCGKINGLPAIVIGGGHAGIEAALALQDYLLKPCLSQ